MREEELDRSEEKKREEKEDRSTNTVKFSYILKTDKSFPRLFGKAFPYAKTFFWHRAQ